MGTTASTGNLRGYDIAVCSITYHSYTMLPTSYAQTSSSGKFHVESAFIQQSQARLAIVAEALKTRMFLIEMTKVLNWRGI